MKASDEILKFLKFSLNFKNYFRTVSLDRAGSLRATGDGLAGRVGRASRGLKGKSLTDDPKFTDEGDGESGGSNLLLDEGDRGGSELFFGLNGGNTAIDDPEDVCTLEGTLAIEDGVFEGESGGKTFLEGESGGKLPIEEGDLEGDSGGKLLIEEGETSAFSTRGRKGRSVTEPEDRAISGKRYLLATGDSGTDN